MAETADYVLTAFSASVGKPHNFPKYVFGRTGRISRGRSLNSLQKWGVFVIYMRHLSPPVKHVRNNP